MTFRAVAKQKAVSDEGIEVYNVGRFTKRYAANGRILDIHTSGYKDKEGRSGTFIHIPNGVTWQDGSHLTTVERKAVIRNIIDAMNALGEDGHYRIIGVKDGEISDQACSQ